VTGWAPATSSLRGMVRGHVLEGTSKDRNEDGLRVFQPMFQQCAHSSVEMGEGLRTDAEELSGMTEAPD
jgi:hypothetical protein